MIDLLLDPNAWASFVTLTLLEIVLGVDNLILISILTDRLPPHQRGGARKLGLIAALVMRIGLLSLVFVMSKLTSDLFTVMGNGLSVRDLLLVVGGLFLLAKGTSEIHEKIEGAEEGHAPKAKYAAFGLVVGQIMVMDVVFSFDSVLTAVGIADQIAVMVSAIIVSVVFMVLAVDWVSSFISRHPTLKVLALSYMLLIGMALIAEGLEFHIPKGYLYFAMAFSVLVEGLNMVIRRKERRVRSHGDTDAGHG